MEAELRIVLKVEIVLPLSGRLSDLRAPYKQVNLKWVHAGTEIVLALRNH